MSKILSVAVIRKDKKQTQAEFYVSPYKVRTYENISEASYRRVALAIYRLQIKERAYVRPYLANAIGFVAQID